MLPQILLALWGFWSGKGEGDGLECSRFPLFEPFGPLLPLSTRYRGPPASRVFLLHFQVIGQGFLVPLFGKGDLHRFAQRDCEVGIVFVISLNALCIGISVSAFWESILVGADGAPEGIEQPLAVASIRRLIPCAPTTRAPYIHDRRCPEWSLFGMRTLNCYLASPTVLFLDVAWL